MPPAHNERAPSSSSPAASFAPRPGTPRYPTGQNKSTPNRPGHEQTAVTAADGKTRSLTAYWAADNSTESVFTMRSSPHRFCCQGLFSRLIQGQALHTAAAPALSQRAVLAAHRTTAHGKAQANSVCNGTVQGKAHGCRSGPLCSVGTPGRGGGGNPICYLLLFLHRQTDRARHLKHRCLSHYRSP